ANGVDLGRREDRPAGPDPPGLADIAAGDGPGLVRRQPPAVVRVGARGRAVQAHGAAAEIQAEPRGAVDVLGARVVEREPALGRDSAIEADPPVPRAELAGLPERGADRVRGAEIEALAGLAALPGAARRARGAGRAPGGGPGHVPAIGARVKADADAAKRR